MDKETTVDVDVGVNSTAFRQLLGVLGSFPKGKRATCMYYASALFLWLPDSLPWKQLTSGLGHTVSLHVSMRSLVHSLSSRAMSPGSQAPESDSCVGTQHVFLCLIYSSALSQFSHMQKGKNIRPMTEILARVKSFPLFLT